MTFRDLVRAIREGEEAEVSEAVLRLSRSRGWLAPLAFAVSGLEMSQNSARISWKEAELQAMLTTIMQDIRDRCVTYGCTAGSDHVDYVRGANIAGFKKVADAMLAFGVV